MKPKQYSSQVSHRPALLLAVVSSVIAWTPETADAEPYLAVRYGYKCSKCHVNPTGGGMRNEFGNIFSQTELPQNTISPSDIRNFLSLGRRNSSPEPSDGEAEAGSKSEGMFSLPGLGKLTPESTFYTGHLASFLSVGGDFRFNNRTVFRNSDDSTSNTFDVTEGNLYARVGLIDGLLDFYIDETVAPGGAASREIYGLLYGPWNSYAKVGRMMLPFGLRLQDDAAFIREITGFNYGVQDLGVEVGAEPGPFSFSLAVSNGTQGSSDDNKDKQVTGLVSFIQRHWRVGTQATWNNTPDIKSVLVGGFAGVNVGRFTLLGEIDHIIDELESLPGEPTQRQLLLYGAVNYHLTKGVNLKLTYDYADPDTSESNDRITRTSLGIEYFPTQFVQLRSFYRFRDDPDDDVSSLNFEIHLFF